MKRTDVIVSLIIGELAAILAVAVSRSFPLPSGVAGAVLVLPLLLPALTFGVMAGGTILARRVPVAYQFSKFLLVGGLNFLIDLGVLNLLIALTGIASGFSASVAKGAAFLVAMSSSFLWNKFWTFRALSTEDVGRQFSEFFVVTLGGFLINVGTFALVNDLIGPPPGVPPRAWASAAAAAAAVGGLLWNFSGYKFFVFRRPKR